jgi:AbrB family looped-hinge helix DNA binding protein
MATATITSKGQITIPAKLRSELRLEPGDRIEFIRNVETGNYEVIPVTLSVQALKGMVPKPKVPVSIADMNEAIARRGAVIR